MLLFANVFNILQQFVLLPAKSMKLSSFNKYMQQIHSYHMFIGDNYYQRVGLLHIFIKRT